jgi:hypothetical protein
MFLDSNGGLDIDDTTWELVADACGGVFDGASTSDHLEKVNRIATDLGIEDRARPAFAKVAERIGAHYHARANETVATAVTVANEVDETVSNAEYCEEAVERADAAAGNETLDDGSGSQSECQPAAADGEKTKTVKRNRARWTRRAEEKAALEVSVAGRDGPDINTGSDAPNPALGSVQEPLGSFQTRANWSTYGVKLYNKMAPLCPTKECAVQVTSMMMELPSEKSEQVVSDPQVFQRAVLDGLAIANKYAAANAQICQEKAGVDERGTSSSSRREGNEHAECEHPPQDKAGEETEEVTAGTDEQATDENVGDDGGERVGVGESVGGEGLALVDNNAAADVEFEQACQENAGVDASGMSSWQRSQVSALLAEFSGRGSPSADVEFEQACRELRSRGQPTPRYGGPEKRPRPSDAKDLDEIARAVMMLSEAQARDRNASSSAGHAADDPTSPESDSPFSMQSTSGSD